MSKDYLFAESEDGLGRVFVPRGPWEPAYAGIVARENVNVVRLSASAGWPGEDLDFLRELRGLRGVEVYRWDVRDASVVESLCGLRLVSLECDLRRPIDFTALPHLEVFKATWKKGLESVFSCSGLRHINVSNWPEQDLQPLAGMRRLATLLLTSRKLSSLGGISALPSLERLDLHACTKLTSLEELRACRGILYLEITSCRAFRDVSPIGDLHALRELKLDDCGRLDTLTPLRDCKKLEGLSFVGTTRVADGELSFIRALPKLGGLRFASRRHYNRTRAQLLAGREPA